MLHVAVVVPCCTLEIVGIHAGDATDFRRSELEAQLKTAIELGRTVVLVNAASMYSALYDVLVSPKLYCGSLVSACALCLDCPCMCLVVSFRTSITRAFGRRAPPEQSP